MSDHDTPHPVDRAYTQAEALLDDDAARRARRARVLEAVAREPASSTAAPAPRVRPRLAWKHAGWLTAAGVAGLGALIAFELAPTGRFQPAPSGPTTPAPASAPAPAVSPAPSPSPDVPAAPPPQGESAPRAEERRPEVGQTADATTPPPAAVAPPPVAAPQAAAAPPPAAFPASQERVESVEARRVAPPTAPAQAPSARVQAAAASSPVELGARLRAAAAAGQTREVAELLAEGAPVDARDRDGETALMKSILANQPTTAALLRRRGANLDLENRAGVSARQMVEAAGNPALERALSTDR